MYLTLEPTATKPIRLDAKLLTYNGIGRRSLDPGWQLLQAARSTGLSSTPWPANDDPATQADLVPASSGTVTAPLPLASTLAPPQSELPGLPTRARELVWFRWQAPATGVFSLQVIPGTGGRPLDVRVLGPGSVLLFDGPPSRLPPFLVQTGDVLAIAVYQTPTWCCSVVDHASNASVRWAFSQPAANDRLAAAIDIGTLPGINGGSGATAVTVNAPFSTVETDEPYTDPAEVPNVRGSLWWRYQATSNSLLRITTDWFAAYGRRDAFSGTGFSDFTELGDATALGSGKIVWIWAGTTAAPPSPGQGWLLCIRCARRRSRCDR